MHEMALASGILKIVLDYAEKNEATKVGTIALKIGEFTNVEEESLSFCLSILTKGTCAEGAQILYQKVPLTAYCPKCARTIKIKKLNFLCPNCKEGMTLVSGRELQVDYLEVD